MCTGIMNYDNFFSPIMPQRINARHKIRMGLLSSPSITMPYTAVPIVPMPTQTAYAVPMGSVLVASERRYMLKPMKKMQNKLGQKTVKPFVFGIAAA
jgi:hypothetical protein